VAPADKMETPTALYVRGVLGNKCAGHYNLKTVHFRETLASDNFLDFSDFQKFFSQAKH
jgi:hypothetical protein